ncbi:MAG: N-glycosylase/DNA lyase [Promethearchaeota archaeon]
MEKLLETVEQLKKSEVLVIVENRINDFNSKKHSSIKDIFKELCFCIMTANCGAEKCIEIHEKINNEFLNLSQPQLAEKFKELGYRFPNVRSKFIVEARGKMETINEIIKSNKDEIELREWLVKNIKGIGYKEGSHFLRNIGYKNLAIVDFHILDLMAQYELIGKLKSLTKSAYFEIENILKSIAEELDLNLAELDLYLWYLETGKILK